MAKKPVQLDANGYRKFGMRDKIAYAAGDLGCNMSFALKSSIMAIFWTQFMALGEELYATLLVIVQIWDAINDPLLGSLFDADKRKYKRGKFKTYIFIGAFDSEQVCLNVISYIQTRFFRFLAMLRKVTQSTTRSVYTLIPQQNFSESWSDDKLYKKYGLSNDEIAFIESMIQPME